MKRIKSLILMFSMVFTFSCMDMYNEIADDFGEYNYFLAVTQQISNGQTYVYSIESTGSVGNQLWMSSFTGARIPYYTASHPTGKYFYIPNNNQNWIGVYQFNSDGSLNYLQNPGSTSPYMIKVHPTGKHAYCTNNTANTIAVFSINDDGTLTSLGTPVSTIKNAVGNTPTKITIDPSGKYLYAVTIDALIGYIINDDGSLPSAPSYEFHDATSYIIINNNSDILNDNAGHVYLTGQYDSDGTGGALSHLNLFCFDKALNVVDLNGTAAGPGIDFTAYSTGYIALHPTDDIIYLGYYMTMGSPVNNFYSYRINTDGTLVQLGNVLTSNYNKEGINDIIVSPKGDYLFVTSNSYSRLEAFKIKSNGVLEGINYNSTYGTWDAYQSLTIANATGLALIRQKK